MLSEYYEVVAVSSPGEKMKVLEEREGGTYCFHFDGTTDFVSEGFYLSFASDYSLCQRTSGYGAFHYA